jgi:dUTPase
MSEKRDASVVVRALMGEGGTPPEYASAFATGADLRASEEREIAAHARAAVPTGR